MDGASDPKARLIQWQGTPKLEFVNPGDWFGYLTEKRLEACCGEGPYLTTPYDATQGEEIPASLDWQRVGILDRKLRVAFENLDTFDAWLLGVDAALRSVYGYEWAGDNLVLARLNCVRTVLDHTLLFCDTHDIPQPDDAQLRQLVEGWCAVVSEQLVQADGLRFVVPNSCSPSCRSCANKLRTGHDGVVPVWPWVTHSEADGSPTVWVSMERCFDGAKPRM